MLHINTEIREDNWGGQGIFATDFIQKGEVVWRLDATEKLIAKADALKLSLEQKVYICKYRNKYLLVTDNSQYMNHSCDPSLWWLDDDTLIARRNIEKGDEITYDYSSTEIDADPVYKDTWHCKCGAINCRGKLNARDCLKESFQELHMRHLPSFTLEYIEKDGACNEVSSVQIASSIDV